MTIASSKPQWNRLQLDRKSEMDPTD